MKPLRTIRTVEYIVCYSAGVAPPRVFDNFEDANAFRNEQIKINPYGPGRGHASLIKKTTKIEVYHED